MSTNIEIKTLLWSCDWISQLIIHVLLLTSLWNFLYCGYQLEWQLMLFSGIIYGYPEFKEDGGWVNIVKQTLIAKLSSNLLEMGFQIIQPCHLARCRSLLHGAIQNFLFISHFSFQWYSSLRSYKCTNIVTIKYLCLTINRFAAGNRNKTVQNFGGKIRPSDPPDFFLGRTTQQYFFGLMYGQTLNCQCQH